MEQLTPILVPNLAKFVLPTILRIHIFIYMYKYSKHIKHPRHENKYSYFIQISFIISFIQPLGYPIDEALIGFYTTWVNCSNIIV